MVAAVMLACGGGGGEVRTGGASTSGQGAASPAGSAVGGKERASQPARPESAGDATRTGRRRVVVMGTSLTAGLGLDPADAYTTLLQHKADSAGLDVEIVNAGYSGETSAGALRRVDWLLREPVDVFVLETGANDGLRALNVDSTRANIEAILARVKAARPAARVLIAQMEAPPNLGSRYTSEFRAMFPSIAERSGATLIPFILEGVAGHADLNQSDGIHPNETGERIVAANIWKSLRPVLEARE